MTELLVPHPDPIQVGVWKYLEDIGLPAVYGCAKQVYGGALLDGGFDDQAGAAAACGGCAPTSLTVPFAPINDFIYEIPYRINYGDVIGDIGFYSLEGMTEINSRDVLGELFVNGPDFAELVVDSGGGIAPFQYQQSTGVVSGGSDDDPGWTGSLPVTIHLLTFADAEFVGSYDFVADVFGGYVSVHACSANNWAGT